MLGCSEKWPKFFGFSPLNRVEQDRNINLNYPKSHSKDAAGVLPFSYVLRIALPSSAFFFVKMASQRL